MEEQSYGTWSSPLSAETLTEKSLRFSELVTTGDNIYWLEGRPAEKGRVALASESGDVLSASVNIKSRVHEYGGGAISASNGHLIYMNDADKCVYLNDKPITKPEQGRFGDFCYDENRACIYAVREQGEINTLAKITLDGTVTDIASGSDFYASPSLGQNKLAWIAWNHPNMPWENTELWLWDFKSDPKRIKQNASIQNPFWLNQLYFLSDDSGFWNLHTQNGPVFSVDADLGYPPWILGIKRCAPFNGKIACISTENATDSLILYDLTSCEYTTLDLPFTSISALSATDTHLCAIASSPNRPTAIVKIDPTTCTFDILKESKSHKLDERSISLPVAISFQNRSNQTIHLFYYPPTNPAFTSLPSEKPPLIMRAHGGPTAHAAPVFNLEIQYWTSRGFAYADINYGGSSGYGKAYRERLNGNWGITDVHDTIDAADYLAKHGYVDPDRMAVKGSSSGGYTALAAATFSNTFSAAVSLYGICDLEALTKTTHKFESHYNDSLIGPYPARSDLYKDRSPINHLDKLSCPVLLLQGAEDKIVPPGQAEKLYQALTQKGIPCTYHLFQGEGHGFRTASTLQKAIQLETNFYTKIFVEK